MASQFCFVFKPEILFSAYLITTGVAQVVEIYEQLTEKSGERQIKNAKIGLAQNMGGSGASSVTHIFSLM